MGIKKDKICCIYKIINIKNGKFYLGSSNNFKQRVKRHKRDLKFNRHHNIYLQRIYNKYGHNIFKYYIIKQCKPKNRIKTEQHYLNNFNIKIYIIFQQQPLVAT